MIYSQIFPIKLVLFIRIIVESVNSIFYWSFYRDITWNIFVSVNEWKIIKNVPSSIQSFQTGLILFLIIDTTISSIGKEKRNNYYLFIHIIISEHTWFIWVRQIITCSVHKISVLVHSISRFAKLSDAHH